MNKERLSSAVHLTTKVVRIVGLIIATIIVIRAFDARSLPDLHAWHEVRFDDEFVAHGEAERMTLSQYLDHERAVFDQLAAEVEGNNLAATSRFKPGGQFNSRTHAEDWNRTVELRADAPRGTALMLHGLTDSPYSMRGTAELLHERGFHVLVPRLPGHGTAPAGIGQAQWEDWQAVVQVGVRHLVADTADDTSFVLVGYSNGGALAVNYALDALEDDSLPMPDKIVLLSPAIGVTPFAFFATWNRTLSWLPFFKKFAWASVLPEYDPYKYNSFHKAAGNETYELTHRVQKRLRALKGSETLDGLPPIITFVPLVDATVRTDVTVNRLYDVLNRSEDELVIYDLNRYGEIVQFLRAEHKGLLEQLSDGDARRYRLTVVANRSPDTREMVAVSSGGAEPSEEALAVEWPLGIYSLSHVAVPFSSDDPWYGDGSSSVTHVSLGRLNPYGEKNLLSVSPAQIMRLRYNPFYEYQSRRLLEFLNLDPEI